MSPVAVRPPGAGCGAGRNSHSAASRRSTTAPSKNSSTSSRVDEPHVAAARLDHEPVEDVLLLDAEDVAQRADVEPVGRRRPPARDARRASSTGLRDPWRPSIPARLPAKVPRPCPMNVSQSPAAAPSRPASPSSPPSSPTSTSTPAPTRRPSAPPPRSPSSATASATTPAPARSTSRPTGRDLAGATFLVEAVAEEPAVKGGVLGHLDSIADADAIIATTTSSLSITELAVASGRPDRFVGLHVFNPVPRMQLIELAFPVAGVGDDDRPRDRAVRGARQDGGRRAGLARASSSTSCSSRTSSPPSTSWSSTGCGPRTSTSA